MDVSLGSPPLLWAADQLGSQVVEARPLSGGITSTMLALTTAAGEQAVLRLMTNEPWRTHGTELVMREAETQMALAGTAVPAPSTLAVDPTGAETRDPAHLMTLLPGEVDTDRASDGDLDVLARELAGIHAFTPAARPRTYQSWAVRAKHVVPGWARRPAAWERAFEVLGRDPPAYEGVFLHRDFAPRNVLWTRATVTGIVDWVETSWGPPWLDVAHFRTMLAVRHGTDVADRFGATYQRLTGREPQPYFDVMDVVGLLPSPGRQPFLTAPEELARLETHLVSLL